jgi:DNA-binding NtrC family response regulator
MMKKAKILAIDNALEVREILKEFLQVKGYVVRTLPTASRRSHA